MKITNSFSKNKNIHTYTLWAHNFKKLQTTSLPRKYIYL